MDVKWGTTLRMKSRARPYIMPERGILVSVGVGISRVEVFRTACLMRHCSI